MEIPKKVPEMSPLKLVTMTIDTRTNQMLNLDVIARYCPINERILGIKYLKIKKGAYSLESKEGRFKNQCTFRVDVGAKIVNTKLFNNGEIVIVGCKDVKHAHIATDILLESIRGMKGHLEYIIPDKFNKKTPKKFYKDEVKKNIELYRFIASAIGIKEEIFDSEELFLEKYTKEEVLYINKLVTILKSYFVISDNFDEIKPMVYKLISYTEGNKIRGIFPSYIPSNRKLIPCDFRTVLINNTTNCNYYINRDVLVDLVKGRDDIWCEYNKNRYPGVIIQYNTCGKKTKIIVFDTGKINFTAATTFEQVDSCYKFIKELCEKNFKDLLFKQKYINRMMDKKDQMPDKVHKDGVILLRKGYILNHPRNVKVISELKMIGLYL